MENEVRHPVLAVIVLVLLGGAVVAFIVFSAVIVPKRSLVVQEQLLEPYFKLVDEGRLEEAWHKFTTARYRKEWPLEKYLARWKEHADHLGKITKREARQNGYAGSFWGGGFVFGIRYQMWWDKGGMYVVQYQVVDEDGAPKIDWSGSTRMAGISTPSSVKSYPDPY